MALSSEPTCRGAACCAPTAQDRPAVPAKGEGLYRRPLAGKLGPFLCAASAAEGYEAGCPPRQAGAVRACGFVPVLALFLAAFLASSCGYHVVGRGSRLPAELHTLAVPAFENRTMQYRIEQRLTEAVVHELLARTKYRVVPDEASADAVLRGEVTSIESAALLFDTNTGRATTMLVTVRMKVRLLERDTKKPLYQNDSFLFREEYQISTDVKSFFEEREPAFGRLARDFAASLVSALLENF